MREYRFSLVRIFPHNNRILEFVLIGENTGQRKPVFCVFMQFYDITFIPIHLKEYKLLSHLPMKRYVRG